MNLDQCFTAFKELETLTGFDTVYCRKCKEHRDVTKKLQVYQLPRIVVIQLRRFTS